MRLTNTLVVTLFAALMAFSARSFAANAAPFGLEIGVATIDQVKKEVGSKNRLEKTGTNKFSQGAMYSTDGSGLDIDGLQSALFIFDPSNVLVGVVIKMNKDPKSMAKTFSTKYQVVSNRIDNFMNYGYARFQKGDSFIEIDAAHLSFDMEVRYVTKGLMAKFNQTSDDEETAKKQKKANAL